MKTWTKLLLLMTVSLFAKFYLYRILLYHDSSVWNFLAAETTSLLLILLLLIFISLKRLSILYIIGNILLSIVLFAILVYFTYYGKIPTYQALMQLGQAGEVRDSIISLIKPSYFLLFADLLLYLVGKRWIDWKRNSVQAPRFLSRKYVIVAFAVVLVFSIGKVKAEKSNEILNENKRAEKMGVLTYQLDTFLMSKAEQVDALNVSKSEVQDIKGESIPEHPNMFGIAKQKNLIVIQMEAFQNFLIGAKINGEEITPNLNRLVAKSTYFPHVFHQIGIGNTSDAEFMSNTSIYPVGEQPMSKKLANHYIPSLPRYLENMRYSTMTLHVNDVHFWDRNLLYPALGFEKYYDQEYFGKDNVIGLGPSDDVLFSKTIPILKEKADAKQPFYAQMITLSGHYPFEIPDAHKTLNLPPEYVGTKVGNYITAQHYVDEALGRFFDQLKANGLWDNTMIVLYGDHHGLPKDDLTDKDNKLMQSVLGRPYDLVDMFNIPLIMKIPGKESGSVVDRVGGQLDIMPTIANLLGLDLSKKLVFGEDLLNTKHNLLGVRFYLPTGSFFTDDVLFVPGYQFEDGTAIDIRTHQERKDIAPYRDKYERILKLERSSDAFVNQLPEQ